MARDPAPRKTFYFRTNEGPLRLPVDFSGDLAYPTRLDDFDLHAHFRATPDSATIDFYASSANGLFAVEDSEGRRAEITIPLATVEEKFSEAGTWHFDTLLIDRTLGDRVVRGTYVLEMRLGITREVT